MPEYSVTLVNPVVTVFVLVYNQKKFVKRCIDGVLMQKTSFAFDVVVHDDASSDGTSSILQEMESFDSRLKVIRQPENIFSRGDCLFNLIASLATSRYVALVEGDDFWTDPSKLQKQVDLLESEPGMAMCIHPVEYVDAEGNSLGRCWPPPGKPRMSIEDFVHGNSACTASIVYRREFLLEYPGALRGLKLGDWPLCLILSSRGSVGCVQAVMACYRVHSGGIWSTKPLSFTAVETARMWIRLSSAVPELREVCERGLCSQVSGLAHRIEAGIPRRRGFGTGVGAKVRKVWRKWLSILRR